MTTTTTEPGRAIDKLGTRGWIFPDVLRCLARRPELAPAIANSLQCSETALWQRIMRLIDDPDFVRDFPSETGVLRRRRDQLVAKRTGLVDP